MESSRISLRPFKVSDADDFLKWASNDKVTHYLRWNSIQSREEALKYIQEIAIPHPWRQSICLDDHSIGYISVRPESGNDRHRAHIGYAVGSDHWRQGIVTKAMKMAIPRVFEKFPCLVRLEALVEEENVGSQRVLEKVGFKKEGHMRKYGFNKGEIRDMFVYSFLSTDQIIE
ncbi:Acyl-CoA N-acyltransferases (NAT) superfamily protein [Abeliophyllum distichum]|uniref:Acyl-CoA N-acyltransferases (NAT) superfamily protein n=1 Tax=Abeliophyllum distichum TaxID=126358 RepID=A0ABD1Q100_9LAMI